MTIKYPITYQEFIFQYSLGTIDYDTLLDMANSRDTDKKILTILSKDENFDVRSYIAKNPNTPIEILTILSKDKNWSVRYYVAKNPNTPIKERVKYE